MNPLIRHRHIHVINNFEDNTIQIETCLSYFVIYRLLMY